jgi:hypothetical protein
MIAFGFPKGSVSQLSEESRLSEIIQANPSFGSYLRRVGVLKSPGAKRTETIVLGFSDPAGANTAIDNRIAWEVYIIRAEPYTSSIRITRYFKCQSYTAHTAKTCYKPTRCGWCAKIGHTADLYPSSKEISTKAYAPYGGTKGYSVLDRECPLRVQEWERVRAAYASRPLRFNLGSNLASQVPRQIPLPAESASPTRATRRSPPITPIFSRPPPSQEPEEEGYIVVGSKRRRGHPLAITTADTSGIPNISTFLRIPDIQFISSLPSNKQLVATREEAMTDSPGTDK